jgi:hypothetical protein
MLLFHKERNSPTVIMYMYSRDLLPVLGRFKEDFHTLVARYLCICTGPCILTSSELLVGITSAYQE